MDKVHEILRLAGDGIPQALSRFNDGECSIILNRNAVAARGRQKGSIQLQSALIDAIRYEQKNYWKGYPCNGCYPDMLLAIVAKGYQNPFYAYNTEATVNTNRNLETFSIGLQESLKRKQVIVVSDVAQDWGRLGFDIVKHIVVPESDSFSAFEKIMKDCLGVAVSRRVYLFSAGPVARILVRRLFQLRPDCSFLDVGDTYSNITKNVWRKVHRGKLKKCEICN